MDGLIQVNIEMLKLQKLLKHLEIESQPQRQLQNAMCAASPLKLIKDSSMENLFDAIIAAQRGNCG